jgi:hypothetical protein
VLVVYLVLIEDWGFWTAVIKLSGKDGSGDNEWQVLWIDRGIC